MSVFSGLAGRLPRAVPASRALPSRYRWLNAILAAAVVGLGIGAYFTVNSSSAPATLASIRTAPVTRGVVLSSVSATGNIEAASQLAVNFRTSGTISAVDVKVGQKVKAGQILGRIDPTDATAAVQEAEASLKTAQANLELTMTGETAAQRASDALSVRQARAQIGTATAAVATAKQQQAQDGTSALASIAQAERQVRTDLGNEAAAVAQLKTDLGTNANLGAAQAAVTAAQAKVTADQSQQHSDTVTQQNAQTNQVQWNQYLASDKAALATAQANNDAGGVALYTNKSNVDQGALNGIALELQQLSQTLSNDSYQLTQDQSVLTTAQGTVNTVKADDAAIVSDETRIVSDRAAVTTAKTNRTNTLAKDKQGIQQAEQQVSSARMSAQSAAVVDGDQAGAADPAAIAQQQAGVQQAEIALASARLDARADDAAGTRVRDGVCRERDGRRHRVGRRYEQQRVVQRELVVRHRLQQHRHGLLLVVRLRDADRAAGPPGLGRVQRERRCEHPGRPAGDHHGLGAAGRGARGSCDRH